MPAPTVATSKPMILLVDPNPDTSALIRNAFEESGRASVDWIDCTADVAARVAAKSPGLIVLEILQSNACGIELLRQLRSSPHTQHIPVVCLTMATDVELLQAAHQAGATMVIRKPLGNTELAEIVRHLELSFLVLNEPPLLRGAFQ